jgi:hypothetical protein
MKKRDRKPVTKVMTQDQINAVGSVLVKKIAVLLQEFIKKTGQVVGVVEIVNHARPNGTGFDIQQTVSIKYGAPQQEEERVPLQIGTVGP